MKKNSEKTACFKDIPASPHFHIGKSESVKTSEIVGIFDMDTATETDITTQYLKLSEQEFRTVNLLTDLPKSFIVVAGEYGETVYISSNSPSTLLRRLNKSVSE